MAMGTATTTTTLQWASRISILAAQCAVDTATNAMGIAHLSSGCTVCARHSDNNDDNTELRCFYTTVLFSLSSVLSAISSSLLSEMFAMFCLAEGLCLALATGPRGSCKRFLGTILFATCWPVATKPGLTSLTMPSL